MSALSLVSILMLCHSILSALRWRMFLQGNSQPITALPTDVSHH